MGVRAGMDDTGPDFLVPEVYYLFLMVYRVSGLTTGLVLRYSSLLSPLM